MNIRRRDQHAVQIPASSWALPAGKIWEWRVSAPPEFAQAEATTSPVPPSYIQERHVRRAAANAKLAAAAGAATPSSVWEAVSVEFDTPLDREALGEVWRAFLNRHDSLRSWFEVHEFPATGPAGQAVSKVLRHEVDPETLSWELTSGPTFATGQEARDYLAQRFDTSTSPLRWPALIFAAVEHDDGFIAVFAEDHSFCDGYASLIAIAEIKALYEAQTRKEPVVLPDPGSQLRHARDERQRLASLTIDSPQTQSWISYYHSLGGQLQKFPLELDVDPDRPSGTMRMFDLLTEAEAKAFHQHCKKHGGGFGAGLYAAFATTNHELGGHDQFNALRAVSTRDDEQYTYTHGWFINTVPVVFDLANAESFTDLVPRAQQSMNENKELTSVPIQRVIDLVAEANSQTDAAGIPFCPPPMISYIDLQLFPSWIGTKETAYHKIVQPVPPTSTVFFWLNRYYDVLEIVAYFPGNPTAESSITKYVDHLAGVLRSVAASGDHELSTPALSHA